MSNEYVAHAKAQGDRWLWEVVGTQYAGEARRLNEVAVSARTFIEKALGLSYTYEARGLSPISVDVRLERPYDLAQAEVEERPPAVIYDVDGTLALHTNRGPYDFDRMYTDTANTFVVETLRASLGKEIILVSGRYERYRNVTERWLRAWEIPYDALHMRPDGDHRSDDIVKLEIFDREIRHKYLVRGCFDDRDRCVYLWRKLGITCCQVEYGDF